MALTFGTNRFGFPTLNGWSVDLYAPGRGLLGIGAGDTAVLQVGLHPARLAQTEQVDVKW